MSEQIDKMWLNKPVDIVVDQSYFVATFALLALSAFH